MNTELVSEPRLGASADAMLRRTVECAIRDSGYPPLYAICVEVVAGRIVLEGRVSTYYLKQIAQSVAMSVQAELEVDNRLVVAHTQVADRAFSLR